jgi:adenine-specific DNA-methyltransferase
MDFKKSRGQFFTTKNRVLEALTSLIGNNGNILEPSAGQGNIIKSIEDKFDKQVVGVELDSVKVGNRICNSDIEVKNFFDYIKESPLFDTIIGNPPFVKLKNVEKIVIDSLPEKIPGNGNLYYFFIKYCVTKLNDNGELIFIVPKEWLFNVSSRFVREFLSQNGNFTHFIDCGEEKLFDDADVPALCIFRYQKGYFGNTKFYNNLNDFYSGIFTNKQTTYSNTITFSNDVYLGKRVYDYFDIKVGLVTGAEKVFNVGNHTQLSIEGLISIIGTNKEPSKYIFVDNFVEFDSIPLDIQLHLLRNKPKLIDRKIKKFNEKNWWNYGALRNFELMSSDRKRIYGLMKTRENDIFWVGNEFEFFGGGLVGLFLKEGLDLELNEVVNKLNSQEFKKIMKESNMYSNNKVSITPSVLSNLPFPFF